MKILIIGGGGREHALAWKLSHSKHSPYIYVAPGNAGTLKEKNTINVDIKINEIDLLTHFAKDNQIDLTIVGPELPLSLGIVNAFERLELACLGPNKECAQLESSKSYSKDFMVKYDIPTASYKKFTDSTKAKIYLDKMNFPIVIKVDGLASGKGVIIAKTKNKAYKTIDEIFNQNIFGSAGSKIIIEEFLAGEEASFIVLSDGSIALAMESSQDHKALYNGNNGPNTGGMGAYSPVPIVTSSIHNNIMENIVQPVINGMKQEGSPYKGFLYVGVMIMPNKDIKVLEFNCRLGDPETQPIMMRLESDLVDILLAAFNGTLENIHLKWSNEHALGVVMATDKYPESSSYQEIISGLNNEDGMTNKIFHASTCQNYHNIFTCGGRILCVTAMGETIEKAYENAYTLVNKISWNSEYHRTDIGYKAFTKVIT